MLQYNGAVSDSRCEATLSTQPMSPALAKALDVMTRAGWQIQRKPAAALDLPDVVTGRYQPISPPFVEFLTHVDTCMTPDGLAWLFCEAHYNESRDWVQRWNEWELVSCELALGRPVLLTMIETFWSGHLPIAGTAKHEFGFLALAGTGAVVVSRDPEVQEVQEVCGSFTELLGVLGAWCRHGDASAPDWVRDFF